MKNIPLLLNHCSEMFSLWHNKELSVRAADKIKRQYFLERKYLGSKDRKFIENLYFDMIRNLRLYQWQIKQNEAFRQESMPSELITVHAYLRRFRKNVQIVFNVRDNLS